MRGYRDRTFNFSFDKQQYRFHISFERATWSVNNEISSGFGGGMNFNAISKWNLIFHAQPPKFIPRSSSVVHRSPVRPLHFCSSRKHRLIYELINSKSISTFGNANVLQSWSIDFEKSFLIFTGRRGGSILLCRCIRDCYHGGIRKLRLLRKKYRETIESMNWSTE